MKTTSKILFTVIIAAHLVIACQSTTEDPVPEIPGSKLVSVEQSQT